MFRLLAILVAVHLSSEVNGAPNALVENGDITTANHGVDRRDVISDVREGKLEDAFTIEEEEVPFQEYETGQEAAGLKTRMLGGSESNRRRPLTNKVKRMGSKIFGRATDCVRPSGSRREADDRDQQGAISPPRRSALATGVPSESFLKAEMQSVETDSAVNAVKYAITLLSNPGADPYSDEKLAKTVDTALNTYHVIFYRPLPKSRKSDKRTSMTIKLAELERIGEEIDARRGATASIFSSAERPANRDVELSEIVALGKKKEAAAKVVRATKAALDDPAADPVNDDGLTALVDLALDRYNKAHGRPPFSSTGLLDKASRMKLKLEALNQIINDLEA